MDISCNGAKVTLLGGLGATSLLAAAAALPDWTQKSGHFGRVNTGLWQFCYTRLDGMSMCDYMDLGFTGAWPSVRILMCTSVLAMLGALYFNIKECFSAHREYEKHTVATYILSGILTIGAIIALLSQDALRPFVSSAFWVALSSAPLTIGVGVGFQMKIRKRKKHFKQVIDAMDARDSSDEEENPEMISLTSVYTARGSKTLRTWQYPSTIYSCNDIKL